MSSLYEHIQAHANYCSNQINILSRSLEKFPPGKLRCYKNGNTYRNVLILDGKKVIIHKKNLKYAMTMARKAVFEARNNDCISELEICNKCIGLMEKHPNETEKLLANQGLCELLSQDNPEADIQEWIDCPYNRNPYHPENLIHTTTAGIKVRSKSEVLCVTALKELGIPFRYEQELVLGDHVYYPDFTILHPVTRKIYIIELFGMMDDPVYAGKCSRKLQAYIANGYIPQDNLICFFESSSKPLSISFVKSILEQLILQG